tara:strand:+ start:65 stop:685 length:621 start_codon:yes stop_codon:yes gene_type:complete
VKKLLKERFQQLAGIRPLYEQPTPGMLHVFSYDTCKQFSLHSDYEGACPNVNPPATGESYWVRAVATPGCDFGPDGCPGGLENPSYVEGNNLMYAMFGSIPVGTFIQWDFSDYYGASKCMEYIGQMSVNELIDAGVMYNLGSESYIADLVQNAQKTRTYCCKEFCPEDEPDEPLDADGDGAVDPDKIITPKAKKEPIEKEPTRKRR